MKKFISFPFLIMIGCFVQSQVYINVAEADQENSADLQIDSENSGFGFPQVMLTTTTSFSPISSEPKPGLVVYNPNLTDKIQPGLYVWVTDPAPAHWQILGGIDQEGTIIQNIDTDFLGYNPIGVGASSPASFTIGGSTATKQRCAKWNIGDGGNGHTYCAYTTPGAINFNDTYTSIRNIGGYIVSVVSTAEWNFVKNNVINDGLSSGGTILTSNIWLGYVKLATPGNGYRYFWMTGETWENNWFNLATTQSYFTAGQPEAASANANPRCTFIQRSAVSADRLWSSQACTTTANMNHVIVEFNQ